jgi:cytochrome P450
MGRDFLGFITHSAREYGDCVLLTRAPQQIILINDPDLIEEVLVTQKRNFIKHFVLRRQRSIIGNGLVVSEGDFWLRQRRLIQPAFHRQRIAAYGDLMVDFTDRLLATWRPGETRDIHLDMTKLTLDIVTKSLFDADVDSPAYRAVVDVSEANSTLQARVNRLFPWLEQLPTPANLRFRNAVQRLDRAIYDLIEMHKGCETPSADVLCMLLHARDEDGSQMTERQVRDEVLTLFFAGQESSALALAWTWWLLAQHPHVADRLAAEVDTVLEGRPPTLGDLPRLQYAEMVINESMRLYPPAYAIGREALEHCILGGYHIPAGATILMSQWVTQRDPRHFDQPEAFRPERWEHDLAKRLPKYAYFPFGGGPRLCIGNTFAMMENVLILARTAQQFRFAVAPGQEVTPQPAITLRPKNGIRVVVQPR